MAFKDKEALYRYDEKWKAENTFHFSIRLQNKTDADLIERINAAESKAGELKKLARMGIQYEKEHFFEQIPEAYPQPCEPIDKETLRLAQVGREYEDMLRRGWVMVEPEKKEETTSESVQDAISRLQRVMEERRAKEAQQAEQKTE